ncbi:unnamed protein product, partial [Rotaria sp. Silwood1]
MSLFEEDDVSEIPNSLGENLLCQSILKSVTNVDSASLENISNSNITSLSSVTTTKSYP